MSEVQTTTVRGTIKASQRIAGSVSTNSRIQGCVVVKDKPALFVPQLVDDGRGNVELKGLETPISEQDKFDAINQRLNSLDNDVALRPTTNMVYNLVSSMIDMKLTGVEAALSALEGVSV